MFEKSSECPTKEVNNVLHLIRIRFRLQVKDTLQGETLVCPCLDLRPYIIVDNVEFGKEGAIGTIIKSLYGYTITLDEILHHLHTIHIGVLLVHQVDIILPALRKVFLRHQPYLLCLVDDVILTHLVISPVDREICPHYHTPDKSLFLILYGIHLWDVLLVKCLEIGHHGRIIHQGYFEHSCLRIGDDCIINRNSSNCHYHIEFFNRYKFPEICNRDVLSRIFSLFEKIICYFKNSVYLCINKQGQQQTKN